MEESTNNTSIFNLQIDEDGQSYLLELAKWSRFLGILGYIGLGLLVIFSLSFAYAFADNLTGLQGYWIAVFYVLFASIYVYPVYAIYKSGKLIKEGLYLHDQLIFNEGLKYIKNSFRYIGILTIVIMGIYALIFIFSLINHSI